MNNAKLPEWIERSNEAYEPIHKRIANAIQNNGLPVHLSLAPQEALYFFINSMQIAYDANLAGIHANALAQTRYCIEALSIVELGVTRKAGREETLERWLHNEITPGKLRQWLAREVWPEYGFGLWTESWDTFMGNLAGAVQPYAHYTCQLAQWQSRTVSVNTQRSTAYIESGPMVYDPQKASRIMLYHCIMNYALARIWGARFGESDMRFTNITQRLGNALGRSRYLDGHQTNWDQQFWAMMWTPEGDTILE